MLRKMIKKVMFGKLNFNEAVIDLTEKIGMIFKKDNERIINRWF